MPAARPQHGDGRSGRARAEASEAHQSRPDRRMQLVALGRAPPSPSAKSLRGLDWFVFFLADAQVGFGPLIAVYLTAQKWTQADIGLVLTVGGLVALIGQMPGGALVDAARSERVVAAFSVIVLAASAFMFAVWPIFAVVLAAKVLHSAASCVLGPAIGAISLGLVGHAAVSDRFGRNARFASLGAGFAAIRMGAIGYLVSNRAVFLSPSLSVFHAARAWHDPSRRSRCRACPWRQAPPHKGHPEEPLRSLVSNRALMIFAGCLVLFHLANAAMLPLTASVVTMRSSNSAAALVAACILVPQVVVAALAPWVGRQVSPHWSPAAAPSRFRRAFDPWRLAGAGQQPLRSRRRAIARWNFGDGSCRPGSPDHRRCHARDRPLQSRPGRRRHRRRNWRVDSVRCWPAIPPTTMVARLHFSVSPRSRPQGSCRSWFSCRKPESANRDPEADIAQ